MVDLNNEHCIDEDGNHEFCQMYIGTVNGVMRQFPAISTDKRFDYTLYDPRVRPWFNNAAAHDQVVVIIIEATNIMDRFTRLSMIKQAVNFMMHTLQDNSWIAVIAFNNDVIYSCFGWYANNRYCYIFSPSLLLSTTMFSIFYNFTQEMK